MKAPCHAVVWYLLPAIGAELANELKKKGMPQKEIAKRLGITPAAVSYYMKKKRGADLKLGKKTIAEIRKLADNVEKGTEKTGMINSVCGICRIAWAERVLCKVHAKMGTCASCSDGKTRCME